VNATYGDLLAPTERLRVVGILNVTPDSFSDGGAWTSLEAAVAHGLAMHAFGADLIDVGGESTRPGAHRVAANEEKARVLPVVRALASAGVPVSIDTTRAAVAEAALLSGAMVVNDVSAGTADRDMGRVVADARCPWILMHSRGVSADMAGLTSYGNVVTDVVAELANRVAGALAAGVAAERLIVDPGLGFAKRPEHDWRLLGLLDQLDALGLPLLIGASRKSFLGRLLAAADGTPRPVLEREHATTAVTTIAAMRGTWGVRVHDVRAATDAGRIAAAIRSSSVNSGSVARPAPSSSHGRVQPTVSGSRP
jgi:dihydropteroate synthase